MSLSLVCHFFSCLILHCSNSCRGNCFSCVKCSCAVGLQIRFDFHVAAYLSIRKSLAGDFCLRELTYFALNGFYLHFLKGILLFRFFNWFESHMRLQFCSPIFLCSISLTLYDYNWCFYWNSYCLDHLEWCFDGFWFSYWEIIKSK